MLPAADNCWRGWLQLLRPPNLLTVPGDPVAGFLLAAVAGFERSTLYMLPAAGASLMLYVAGLISNDYFDYREDSAARPERPLPSGAVSPRAALLASILCALTGIGLASFVGFSTCVAAVALASLVLSYNAFTKHLPVVGAINMGACRGFSLLVGAIAAGWRPGDPGIVIIASLGLALYVTSVTSLASCETVRVRMSIRRWFPCVVTTACIICLFAVGKVWNVAFLVLAIPAVLWPFLLGRRLGASPEPRVLIPTIGAFLRGLLLVQAVFAGLLFPVGAVAAGLILLAWPANVFLMKHFYAS